MKKAFSNKLLALVIAVLTVAALAVVSSAAVEVDASIINDPIGADIVVESMEENEDGATTVVFDVVLENGYMVDDIDLHDGYVTLDPTVTVRNNGSNVGVEIVRCNVGENAGKYVVEDFVEGVTDIQVTGISQKVIFIDGANTADDVWVFEPDGHTYILQNFANYGDVTVLNSKTDYTKVKYDGLKVDADGKIVDMDENRNPEDNKVTATPKINSRFADVHYVGTFANFGTFTFAAAEGCLDAADTANSLSVSSDANKGRFLMFNQLGTAYGGDVVNRGTINVNVRDLYWAANTFKQLGTINVGDFEMDNLPAATQARFRLAVNNQADYVNYIFVNEGNINLVNGCLYIGHNTKCDLVMKDASEWVALGYGIDDVAASGAVALPSQTCDFDNKGTVTAQGGTLQITGNFKNYSNGVIEMSALEDVNPVTGADRAVASNLTFGANNANNYVYGPVQAAADGVDYYTTEIHTGTNLGTITVTGCENAKGTVTNELVFTNQGTITLDYENFLNRASLINKGTLTVTNGEFTNSWVMFINWNPQIVDIDKVSVDGEYNMPVEALGLYNYGTATIDNLTNDGEVVNYEGATLEVTGTWKNNLRNAAFDVNLPSLADSYAGKAKIYCEACDLCEGHIVAAIYYSSVGEVYNYGYININGSGTDAYFRYLYNAGTIDVNKTATLNVFVENNESGLNTPVITEVELVLDEETNEVVAQVVATAQYDWMLVNDGTVNVAKSAALVNHGDIYNNGTINNKGTLSNYDWMISDTASTINNEGDLVNGDADHVCEEHLVEIELIGLIEIKGDVVNTGEIINDWGSDIRVEGTIDNVEGVITNCGMIVNVGEITSTVEGIDNQFSIHGYDIIYVNKAETDAPADDTTKAPAADDKAPETDAQNKVPAAQTSDVAVAGFAIIATLALAGVVVAKKVR